MPQNELPLAGRAALVTGVSRANGIGYATALRLGRLGASLFIQGWTAFDNEQPWGAGAEGVARLAEQLRSLGLAVEFAEADFLDPEAPAQVMRYAVEAFGHVDILIANHAYSTWQDLTDLTASEIDLHLLVNVRGTLLLAKEFALQHDGRPGGRVVMMTSGQNNGAMVREIAYAASKGAILQITRTLGAQLIPKGITVNTINPGPTDTGWPSDEEKRFASRHMPLGRWGEPDDAARLIAWLCTDDARWITGQVINSDGGFASGFRQSDIPQPE